MTDLRKAAEMALAYLENSSPETDTLMQVKPHIWEHRGSLVIQALRQALEKPEQKQWQNLTDDEIKEIVGPWGDTPIKGYTRKLFNQIEAKLKEKNT